MRRYAPAAVEWRGELVIFTMLLLDALTPSHPGPAQMPSLCPNPCVKHSHPYGMHPCVIVGETIACWFGFFKISAAPELDTAVMVLPLQSPIMATNGLTASYHLHFTCMFTETSNLCLVAFEFSTTRPTTCTAECSCLATRTCGSWCTHVPKLIPFNRVAIRIHRQCLNLSSLLAL